MAALWLPGAKIIPAVRIGTMTNAPAAYYCTWHSTENNPRGASATGLANYLNSTHNPGTFVVHPLTGEIVQMLPANRSSCYLVNAPGGVETNRAGFIHIQVEVVAQAATPFTSYWTPAGKAAIQKIAAFARSHGVPYTWPAGQPLGSYGARHHRIAPAASGHYAHSQWRENSHWDPGYVNRQAFFPTAAPVPTKPPVVTVAYPTLRLGSKGDAVKSLQSGLMRVFPSYAGRIRTSGGADGSFGSGTLFVVKEFQRRSGLVSDGVVGRLTWTALGKYGIRP